MDIQLTKYRDVTKIRHGRRNYKRVIYTDGQNFYCRGNFAYHVYMFDGNCYMKVKKLDLPKNREVFVVN